MLFGEAKNLASLNHRTQFTNVVCYFHLIIVSMHINTKQNLLDRLNDLGYMKFNARMKAKAAHWSNRGYVFEGKQNHKGRPQLVEDVAPNDESVIDDDDDEDEVFPLETLTWGQVAIVLEVKGTTDPRKSLTSKHTGVTEESGSSASSIFCAACCSSTANAKELT